MFRHLVMLLLALALGTCAAFVGCNSNYKDPEPERPTMPLKAPWPPQLDEKA